MGGGGAARRLICLLRAGVSWRQAAEVHAQAVILGLAAVPRLFAVLVAAYTRGGAADEGFRLASVSVACGRAARLIAFTSLVASCSRGPDPLRAVALFSELRRLGLRPNQFTFSAVFPASAAAGALAAGEQLHSLALKQGFQGDVFVGSAAVDMYAKCGCSELARKLFDEIPRRGAAAWNALLVGLVQDGNHALEAQALLRDMIADGGAAAPDEVSFSAALRACAAAAACGGASFGRQVHAAAVKLGADAATYVTNALIDMYSKCSGDISEAAAVFSGAGTRDGVAWNTLAAGWLRRGGYEQAISCFRAMADGGASCSLDEASLSTALHAAAGMAASATGAALHGQSVRRGLSGCAAVGSSLITMYARCGDLDAAGGAFSEAEASVAAWTAMIDACKQHGQARRAVELFEQVTAAGLQPDYITFVCVLSACSHGGLVAEGLELFRRMAPEHGVQPGKEHYACVVDMLGRAGMVAEAREFMAAMPAADASSWGALLAACRSHGELELGEEAARRLFEIEPENSGNYVILSNMYRRRGDEAAAEEVRRTMGIRRVKKETSCSWIDVPGGGTAVFKVRDRDHPRSPEIYRMLAALRDLVEKRRKKKMNTKEEEEKAWGHSERIALAYGLLSLPEGAPVRIKKNLRTCSDCHEVFKAASEIFRRVIVLRDTNRFHHFAAGACSCADYW